MSMVDWDWFVTQTAVFGLTLSQEQQQQFAHYLDLLLEWNMKLNLTAVREPADIQKRHFLDSLSCATVMGDLNSRAIIDVGTGAGFPGLPLKILYPDMRLTLVDSVAKKTTFLKTVVTELGLTNVAVVAERSEALGQMAVHREKYDWAVARGVAEMRVLAEYLLPLCRVGGHMLAQKGENVVAELETAVNAFEILGGNYLNHYPIQLPDHPLIHHLVVIEKVAQTPAKYPRRVGKPSKRPLS